MKKEEIMQENRMLNLAEQISCLTDGMCNVGPGPNGFGFSSIKTSTIGLWLKFTPKPVQENVLFPDGVNAYEVMVEAFDQTSYQALTNEECVPCLTSDNPSTRKIAEALCELSKEPISVSLQECLDAFAELMKQDLAQTAELDSTDVGMTQQMG